MSHARAFLATLAIAGNLVVAASAAAESAAAAAQGLVSVIVKLDVEPLATYRGGVPGLAATRAATVGTPRLDTRSARSALYLSHLGSRIEAFATTARRAIPGARIIHRYQVVVGGVSMLVPEDALDALAALPGVRAVTRDALLRIDTDRSPKFIGAPQVWKKLGGQGSAGEGVIVGVLDTGIWPEHPSFADPDPSGNPYPPPPAKWNGGAGPFCEPPKDTSTPLTCTNKLIGAREFLDSYTASLSLLPGEFHSARDSDGHGTHTASTAAGNAGVAATVLGVSRGTISGIAPRAHVAMYRVCAHAPPGGGGCKESDSIAAIQQAIIDGVDVINFSISGGESPYAPGSVEQAFLDAYEAGIFVAASAGNDGPAANTVDHLGGWVATVAATTLNRGFAGKATLKAAEPTGSLKLTGVTITEPIKDATPVVLASAFGDGLCLTPFSPGTFSGEIVVCERGVIARVAKGFNVMAGGAGGFILYNPLDPQDLLADKHFLPALHIDMTQGGALVAFLTTHIGTTGTLSGGKKVRDTPDILAAFSSRGGTGLTLGIAKPDIGAPGVNILAGDTSQPHSTDSGTPGLFQFLGGTSMASPHVTGAAALLRNLHPDWTPGRIKSALMTSARTKKLFIEDRMTLAGPFDAGSGRLDLTKVLKTPVTFDAAGQDFVTHQSDLWNVNQPSVFVPGMPGTLTISRTARNETAKAMKLKLKLVAPADLGVTVPAEIVIPASGEATFDIALNATAVPPGEVRHANLLWKDGHLPITIVRAP